MELGLIYRNLLKRNKFHSFWQCIISARICLRFQSIWLIIEKIIGQKWDIFNFEDGEQSLIIQISRKKENKQIIFLSLSLSAISLLIISTSTIPPPWSWQVDYYNALWWPHQQFGRFAQVIKTLGWREQAGSVKGFAATLQVPARPKTIQNVGIKASIQRFPQRKCRTATKLPYLRIVEASLNLKPLWQPHWLDFGTSCATLTGSGWWKFATDGAWKSRDWLITAPAICALSIFLYRECHQLQIAVNKLAKLWIWDFLFTTMFQIRIGNGKDFVGLGASKCALSDGSDRQIQSQRHSNTVDHQ